MHPVSHSLTNAQLMHPTMIALLYNPPAPYIAQPIRVLRVLKVDANGILQLTMGMALAKMLVVQMLVQRHLSRIVNPTQLNVQSII